MDFKNIIRKNNLFPFLDDGTIGIEKEGLRILSDGTLSDTMHPNNIGVRDNHPYIQTDFAESQLEFITQPENNEKDVYRWLGTIHEVTLRKLPNDEYIWPMSAPAVLPPENDIKVAQFTNEEDVKYREYLVTVYGKYKQMISGIHYNFGFSNNFIKRLVNITNKSEVEVRNKLYMKLARQFIRYQWLLVYFYGATPIVPREYFKEEKPVSAVRSIRTSKYGYVNKGNIKVSYNSVEDYAKTLRSYVDNNQLIAEKEFYSSVRFRGADSVVDLPKKGVKYVEFRLFDINPFAKYGILEKDIRFIRLFAMFLIWLEEENIESSVEKGLEYSNNIALSHPLSRAEYEDEGIEILDLFIDFLREGNYSQEDINIVSEKKEQLANPNLTVGGQLWIKYEDVGDILQLGVELAKEYKEEALEKYYSLTHFSNMELSTQAVISDAIAAGITVEILDENDQFIKLSYKNHEEYVKNGNMTKHDSYISPLIMENKVVTKKVLEKDGFRVPSSYQVTNIEDATRLYPKVENKPIVIKPKSTNYGLGITIFPKGINSIEDFVKAATIALKEDKEIMIEEFITGTEYRFFVLNGETKAVLLRVPANVVGNGVSTIEQLVLEKNKNSLRGDGLSSPLKKIALGDIELLQLKEQGYTKDTILERNEIAYLRANSNISTGGDSIDMTDEVDVSYKTIAEGIASAMFSKVCGVDLIIEDIKEKATDNNYGIIEANFNPMMMMHIFPSKGKSRRLSEDVLKMLFPEKY
ncbi:bifunctional glutamate--cysteine ligase GshA/glutathione synthetase GshB [Gemella sp. GH3]|uniref:bifunctional glutamate--cysteine ligase GshA/glutathione synthetase GshB n=1 Tax=unclassified Gemella TaxID=2624949 RepID=UPI0015CFCA29|nr:MULTISPECIES: bifunctional glutamate--cysteine ligase GshA/glutathione synthetase GshB [unclassified Gemella]MBF0714036.1 bifunctional glutamate--cysteine ligase GshA/glutathione synthetase GshB [Gemella sp. GH3.1]NYS50988.1 bifunctional glutamate--cysteine ligase GshA/glutathione synthetase GshB [Gemella sp. GH3]